MLRLDAGPDAGPDVGAARSADGAADGAAEPDGVSRTYYVTPFVTNGDVLFVFEEPGERSEMLEELLVSKTVTITSEATPGVQLRSVGRRPDAHEQAWARDACTARFCYDQALHDTAQLGTIVAFD